MRAASSACVQPAWKRISFSQKDMRQLNKRCMFSTWTRVSGISGGACGPPGCAQVPRSYVPRKGPPALNIHTSWRPLRVRATSYPQPSRGLKLLSKNLPDIARVQCQRFSGPNIAILHACNVSVLVGQISRYCTRAMSAFKARLRSTASPGIRGFLRNHLLGQVPTLSCHRMARQGQMRCHD